MLYYLYTLAEQSDLLGVFNVFQYTTFRAAGAAATALIFCLWYGPVCIRVLRRLKLGQPIRTADEVHKLADLHGSKKGTPTMGGVLIIMAVTLSCVLWAIPTVPLIWLVLGCFIFLGFVGFADDYTKTVQKSSEGISGRQKLAAQLMTAIFVFFFLLVINRWESYTQAADHPEVNGVERLDSFVNANPPSEAFLRRIAKMRLSLEDLRNMDPRERFFFVAEKIDAIETTETRLKTAYDLLGISNPYLLYVPFFKSPIFYMGVISVIFFAVVIMGSSNAVNLTDGLDGLAIGCTITVGLVYAIFCFLAGNIVLSQYLALPFVPGAGEVAIFCAALVGAGLGFLWWNCHPAAVFMGDTGSLAIGGALGVVAIVVHQEIALVLAGGVFVMEAGSVMLQVAYFKMTKKRLFAMSPIHHHFELKGWNESTVTVRFWILSILFALVALMTLKIR